ncbi:MAG: hypothetical protein Q9212_007083 [Teloschistes hypoglaucus]
MREELMVEHQERCVRGYWADFYYDSSDEEVEAEPFFEGVVGVRVQAGDGGPPGDRAEEPNASNENENEDGRHVEIPAAALGGGNTANNAEVDTPPPPLPAQADDPDSGNDSDDEDGFSEDEVSDSEDSDSASHYDIEIHLSNQQQQQQQHSNNRSLLHDGTSISSSDEGESPSSSSSSEYGNSDDDNTVQGTLYLPRSPPLPRRRLPHVFPARPINHANNNNNDNNNNHPNNTSSSTDSEPNSLYHSFARTQQNVRIRNHIERIIETRQQRHEERMERRETQWQRIMDRHQIRALRLRQQGYNIAAVEQQQDLLHSDDASSRLVQANDHQLLEEDFEEIDVTTFLTSRTYRSRVRQELLDDNNNNNTGSSVEDVGLFPSPHGGFSNPPDTMQTGEESLSTTATTSAAAPTDDAGPPQTTEQIIWSDGDSSSSSSTD